MSVPVSVILERKGADVATIPPEATIAAALRKLAEHDIGALVVCTEDGRLVGIVSERDVVRMLARTPADNLDQPVRTIMSTEVVTCGRDATVDELSATMTERRIRHIPIVEDERLAGIVSIGDVVRFRLDELEVQTEALEQYVTGTHPPG